MAAHEVTRLAARQRWRTLRRDVTLFVRIYRLMLEGDGRRSAALLLMLLFQASVPVAQVWLTKTIVDGLADADRDRAMWAGGLMVAMIFASSALKPVQDVLATQVQDRGLAQVELAMIRAGSRLRDLNRISDPAWREKMGPVREGAQQFSMAITQASQWYGGVLSLVGVLLSLATLSTWIPVALIVTGVIGHLMARKQYDLEYSTMWKLARTGAEMNYAMVVAHRPEFATEVRMFGIGPWLRDRHARLADRSLAELGSKRRQGAIWAMGGTVIYVAALGGSFWYVAQRAEAGAISIGDLALFITALIQAQRLTAQIFATLSRSHDDIRKARDFFPFIDDAAPEIAVAPEGEGIVPANVPDAGIAIRNVAFTYPHDNREILNDVSLDLPAGSVTALVGENGAGKSTLVGLLSRMFDPTRGSITLDGVPYPELDLTAMRDRITVVYQDGAHFALPLEDNIALASSTFTWREPAPGRATARAVGDAVGVGAIAATLPRGYETELTRTFNDSVELSGGQWQLVAFARGMMREDAALAMLDEPSSALDPVREAEQIEHIRRFARARRRSVLLISHRLSTVRWADQIAVLDQGRIVEAGSHEVLIATDGSYAELFRLQSSRYR